MKDEYFKKLTVRAKQRAKLLIARPDFQDDVLAIRNKFKIPPSGFTDDDTNQKWHHEFYQSDDNYFKEAWPKARGIIIQLKKEGKLKKAEELQKEFNNEAPINIFRIRIKKLLKKYKLPLEWKESVRRYILFNNIDSMWLPGNVTINEKVDQDTNLIKLSIGIDDSTTIEDIKKSWGTIKFHQKRLHSYKHDKFQPIKNFDRDKEAYDLKKSGKTYSEIAEILSKKFNKIYGYEDVGSFIKRHKQKTGIN
ncbi:MAG: hypothetical protein ABH819_03615 [Patescibacteria group bacterium]